MFPSAFLEQPISSHDRCSVQGPIEDFTEKVIGMEEGIVSGNIVLVARTSGRSLTTRVRSIAICLGLLRARLLLEPTLSFRSSSLDGGE